MASTPPLVSVYMPTHNRAALLPRAMDSVLSQSYSNLELIVVDDGSTDGTPEVLSRYASEHRVVVIRKETAGGACAARNEAVGRARGPLVTGIDDDDEFSRDRVANLVSFFDPELQSCVYTDLAIAAADGRRRQRFPARVDLDRLLYRNVIGNQVLTLTDRIRAVGGFDERLSALQDYDLWIRLVARFGAARKAPAGLYIQHTEHEGERISTSTKVRSAAYLAYTKHRALMSRSHRKYRLYRLARLSGKRLSFCRFAAMAQLVQPVIDYKYYLLQLRGGQR